MMDTNTWREKYKTLQEYYEGAYDPTFFEFSESELEIDPDETLEVLDAIGDDPDKIAEEITKCHEDFFYFCQKYVKIGHPIKGIIPFILFKYQKRVIREYEMRRFNVIRKFRQGGLTTVTVIWLLWRAMFRENETLLLVSKTDREGIVAGEIASFVIQHLPTWLKPTFTSESKHELHFKDTESKLLFSGPSAARGRSITYLVIDEAAFVQGMERHWAALFPTVATGGNCIAISTVNGTGNWYHEIYKSAEEGKSFWHIINLQYDEHPDYNGDDWAAQMLAQLGPRRFRQEILGDFLGSGNTFFPAEIINKICLEADRVIPERKLYPDWQNTGEDESGARGALWIFKEPDRTREYIIGVDAAEGIGEIGDNSCIQVIDLLTLEQVAEFYSQECHLDNLAKVVERLGIFYNEALIVIENMGPGVAIVSKLQNELNYSGLYYDHKNARKGSILRAGIKVNSDNRPLILGSLQDHLLAGSCKINSIRLANELKTFSYNKSKRRAEAESGSHDDAIFAISLALFARDSQNRSLPPMFGEEIQEFEDVFKNENYKNIAEEIMNGAPEDWVDPRKSQDLRSDEDPFEDYYARHRKNDKLLRQFDW